MQKKLLLLHRCCPCPVTSGLHTGCFCFQLLSERLCYILDVFRNGVSTMTVKELFDFITDLSITEENLDEYLDRAMQISSQRSHHEVSEQEKIDEEVPLLPHFCRTCKKLF